MAAHDSPGSPRQVVIQAARSPLALAAAISIGIGLLMLAVPLFSLQVYDRVLSSGSRETLAALAAMTLLALLVLGLLEVLRASILARLSTRLGTRLAASLLAAGAVAGDPGQGLRDLTRLRGVLSGPALTAMFDAPWLPLALFLVWLLHPTLGWFGLASAVGLAALAVVGDLAARQRLLEAGHLAPVLQQQVDAIGQQRDVVAAMGLLPALQTRFARLHDRLLILQQRAAERGGLVTGIARSARLLIQAGALALGALLVLDGELSGGGMIAAAILLGRALAPLEQMLSGWRSLVQANEGWQRLQALLNHAPTDRPSLALPAPDGLLTLEQVAYAVEERVLVRSSSLTVPTGELLGVVGPSGAGKSTLCRLIVGALLPSSGVIRLDGVDIATQSRATLGRHIGYLPQSPGLFRGTVAENIARMAPEPDAERVVAAARAAGVHEFILGLPQGYDTPLGNDGAPLSAGQRQRLGLARALFGDPRLVVLDEPNAHLDGTGEHALATALDGLKARRATVLLVTHRLNILRHADRILVLDNGSIERIGPRETVLREIVHPAKAA